MTAGLRRVQEGASQEINWGSVCPPRTTMHICPQERNYICCISNLKLLQNQGQWQKHLAWTTEKNELDRCFWFIKSGPKVWRESAELQDPRCLKSSVKFLQPVIIWGTMPSADVGCVWLTGAISQKKSKWIKQTNKKQKATTAAELQDGLTSFATDSVHWQFIPREMIQSTLNLFL